MFCTLKYNINTTGRMLLLSKLKSSTIKVGLKFIKLLINIIFIGKNKQSVITSIWFFFFLSQYSLKTIYPNSKNLQYIYLNPLHIFRFLEKFLFIIYTDSYVIHKQLNKVSGWYTISLIYLPRYLNYFDIIWKNVATKVGIEIKIKLFYNKNNYKYNNQILKLLRL